MRGRLNDNSVLELEIDFFLWKKNQKIGNRSKFWIRNINSPLDPFNLININSAPTLCQELKLSHYVINFQNACSLEKRSVTKSLQSKMYCRG